MSFRALLPIAMCAGAILSRQPLAIRRDSTPPCIPHRPAFHTALHSTPPCIPHRPAFHTALRDSIPVSSLCGVLLVVTDAFAVTVSGFGVQLQSTDFRGGCTTFLSLPDPSTTHMHLFTSFLTSAFIRRILAACRALSVVSVLHINVRALCLVIT
jgi:hypothetical protein